MEGFSKVYRSKDNKFVGFRYNYTEACLEYVIKYDLVFDDEAGTITEVELSDWDVLDSIGLSRENWEESPEYWMGRYRDELDEQLSGMVY